MLKRARDFLRDEDGAVTVDWIVLTAGVVGLMVFLLVGMIRESMVDVSVDIGEHVTQVGSIFD